MFSDKSTFKNNELNNRNFHYWSMLIHISNNKQKQVDNQHCWSVNIRCDCKRLFDWSLFLRWKCQWENFMEFFRDHLS